MPLEHDTPPTGATAFAETPTCLDLETVAGFTAGTLAGPEFERAEAHLSGCRDCFRILTEAKPAAHVLAPASAACRAQRPEPSPASESAGPRAPCTRFEQLELIASGGMAVVYRGHDHRTGRDVAIKRLKPWLVLDNPELVVRFAREAELLARLNHPNIVRLIGTLPDPRSPGIVMEYMGGGSLRRHLAGERWPLRAALALVLELSDALARAHHLGIIHRDIKPENVLLADDGTARLTDFGLARQIDQSQSLSTGVVGTIEYLSPEALWGRTLDQRADLWGLGLLLFELIASRRPFHADSPGALIAAILHQPLPDLLLLRPELPLPVVELVARLLDKDRDRRLPSARQLGVELDALLNQSSLEAPLGRTLPRSEEQGVQEEARPPL
jgi:serine/threonine protein kinase